MGLYKLLRESFFYGLLHDLGKNHSVNQYFNTEETNAV